MSRPLLLTLAALVVSVMGCDSGPVVVVPDPALTLDDVYHSPITSLVGQEVTLRSEVAWGHWFRRDSPADTHYYTDTTFVTAALLPFPGGDSYIEREDFRGEGRGDIWVADGSLGRTIGPDNVEVYTFEGRTLQRDSQYRLTGRFRYRDWLNVTEETLADSAFIAQSNNVTYWNQLFEFEILRVVADS